jgi:thiamine-phosphate pyrophosphorylase
MFSDERMSDAFLPALARMPKGSGLVFRHYALPHPDRHALFNAARRIARARRIVIVLAGTDQQARAWRADGVHGRAGARGHGDQWRTAPVHNQRELVATRRIAVDLVFISPVFATRSHPGARTLGIRGFEALARAYPGVAIALGGMNARRARKLRHADGWAGIDNWLPAPPT